jgi:hypothetical protein
MLYKLFGCFFPRFNYYILGSVVSGIGGSVVGGILGYKGAQDANQANKEIASARNKMEVEEALKARQFSAEQAKLNRAFTSNQAMKQMGFQERMSSTAVSRRMADMKNAGINPILAGKYDASSPAGAMGQGSQPATAKANAHGYEHKNEMASALDRTNTALGIAREMAEIGNIKAQTKNTLASAGIKSPFAEVGEGINNFVKWARDYIEKGGSSAGKNHFTINLIEEGLSELFEDMRLDTYGGHHWKAPKSAGDPLKLPLQGYTGKRNLFKFDK